jgi:hypothetical protein
LDAGIEVDRFFVLDVPDEVLLERCTGRRVDPATGKTNIEIGKDIMDI